MDAELAERARRGDRAAFAELVRLHEPVVSRFAFRQLGRREEAEEIVQEAFLRAWRQMARFRPGTSFRAWILTIVRFLAMARRKDAQRHPPPSGLDDRLDPVAPPLPEKLEKLRAAVDSLPLHHREIVAMRFFEGLDYRAISELTGETEVNLRSRLHDAMERLRATLGPPE